ncbi:MAG: hypothetical protein ACNS62_00875 [Candidatus Cyclobacteriaceae bacterium M3_2C_046]
MKKLALFFALTFFGVVSFNAFASLNATEIAINAENKEKVESEQLPQAIKETLGQDEYKEWTIKEAYKVTEENETYYEVHLNKDEQTQKVNFSQNGEVKPAKS